LQLRRTSIGNLSLKNRPFKLLKYYDKTSIHIDVQKKEEFKKELKRKKGAKEKEGRRERERERERENHRYHQ